MMLLIAMTGEELQEDVDDVDVLETLEAERRLEKDVRRLRGEKRVVIVWKCMMRRTNAVLRLLERRLGEASR